MFEYEYLQTINLDMVQKRLPFRFSHSYKGSFGSLLAVCGCKNMVGAAIMSISSALKCGVGLITAAIPNSIYDILASKLTEITFEPLDETEEGTISRKSREKISSLLENNTAVMVGCGLGWNNDIKEIVYNIIKKSKSTIILDADGINVVSENINVLNEARSDIIITPHLGEAARLLNLDVDEINTNKIGYAKKLAERYGITVVLKCENTIIVSKNGEIFMNKNPNSGMSKAGCGDVLTGMISSFAAQKLNAVDAAICGVYLHSAAGENCKNNLSKTSMLPTDIINELPNLFLKIEK
ncbi:hypothetical protein FACS189465_3100 [Clostridia bacterium]|nr:hypothetical protein FACS189465_3100 [Clostridia bacterium]